MNLNQEQSAVVHSPAKNKLVLAGPGAGKSATLVAAIRHEIETGTPASSIIAITFTNAAANVLQDRLGDAKLGVCSTLHSFMFKLLRQHGELIGLPAQMSVIDDDARQGVVETIMADMGCKVSVKKVVEMLTPERWADWGRGANLAPAENVCVDYYRTLKRNGLLDFDMLLFYGLKVVKDVTAISKLVWPYTSLFVDESQDNSTADWKIYDAMPCARKSFTGDPDQSVYGFRGSNMQEFVSRAAGAQDEDHKVFTLETNYRCKSEICKAANALIAHNLNRVPKQTRAANNGGEVSVHSFDNPAAEQCFVLEKIVRKVVSPSYYRGIAVLARTNPVANSFAEFLRGKGIPVAERKQVELPADWGKCKLLLGAMAAPWNDFAVFQYLVERDGRKKASCVKALAAMKMMGLNEYLIREFSPAIPGLQSFEFLNKQGIGRESVDKVKSSVAKMRGDGNLADLILALNEEEDDGEVVGAGVFVGTAHSAKGKEWKTVFIVGAEEGLFPMLRKDTDLSEERRIAYVGLTRASDRVFITYCKERPQNRGTKKTPGPMEPRQLSRFIGEMGLIL